MSLPPILHPPPTLLPAQCASSATSVLRPPFTIALLILLVVTATACDLFTTRTPEPPIAEGGTFLQPDTPDQVIANIQSAIAELNTQNYRRSFAPDMTFEPTGSAQARDPAVWTGWSRAEEERYFRTLAADARLTTGNELRLNDRTLSVVREDRFVLDATYVLTIFHRRPHLSESAQGRLVWAISQAEDGLWYVSEWTDQDLSGAVSWSDLKAEFVK
jgi:hypothetical protein